MRAVLLLIATIAVINVDCKVFNFGKFTSHLVREVDVKKDAKPSQQIEERVNFVLEDSMYRPGAPKTGIKGVIAWDRLSNGANAVITSGGIGQNNIEILVTSAVGKPLNVNVAIYIPDNSRDIIIHDNIDFSIFEPDTE